MSKKRYNPETRWRGKSYRKDGKLIADLREKCIHGRTQEETCDECSEQRDCYDLQA